MSKNTETNYWGGIEFKQTEESIMIYDTENYEHSDENLKRFLECDAEQYIEDNEEYMKMNEDEREDYLKGIFPDHMIDISSFHWDDAVVELDKFNSRAVTIIANVVTWQGQSPHIFTFENQKISDIICSLISNFNSDTYKIFKQDGELYLSLHHHDSYAGPCQYWIRSSFAKDIDSVKSLAYDYRQDGKYLDKIKVLSRPFPASKFKNL